MRSSAYPTYWYYNAVRVEGDTAMSVGELIAFADEALDGLAHRKIDFDEIAQAERLRGEFEAAGWQSRRLVLMLHEAGTSLSAKHPVAEVPFETTEPMRIAWHNEDFPASRPTAIWRTSASSHSVVVTGSSRCSRAGRRSAFRSSSRRGTRPR